LPTSRRSEEEDTCMAYEEEDTCMQYDSMLAYLKKK
jgi:hypothetical protein